MIKVQALPRIFTYNGVTLPDPNPDFTPEQVREMYVPTYPELATAAIDGPRQRTEGWNTHSPVPWVPRDETASKEEHQENCLAGERTNTHDARRFARVMRELESVGQDAPR